MPLKIRRLEKKDMSFVKTIANLVKDNRDCRHWKTYTKRNVEAFVAEKNNEVIGFGQMSSIGHINCLYIHPEHQKKGVGSELLSHLEKRAGHRGLDEVVLISRKESVRFYQERGYKRSTGNFMSKYIPAR